MRIAGGRRRGTARLGAGLLAIAALGAMPAPADAARTTFTQPGDVFAGGPNADFANATAIAVPGQGSEGPGAPYPSEITVAHQGTIVDVNLRFHDVTHTWPDDLDVLLVGPTGAQAIVMSDVGGATDISTDINIDDEASTPMPDEGPLGQLARQPTNVGAGDSFAAPAPATTGNTSLSVFDGTSPVGTWQLFVTDGNGGEVGQIAGGWELFITTSTTPYPSTLSVSGLPAVTDVNVALHGVTSNKVGDLDLLLVGPGGQEATIMSDSGTFGQIAVDLTLDDEAPTPLPDTSTTLTSGTYAPTNHGSPDAFPAPAPAATGASALSVFDGLDPNGLWSLYAVDDVNTGVASLSGWSLELSWADVQSPGGSVSVSGGAAIATSKAVTLSLNATDPAPASGVAQMRFSNDGTTYSAYQPYAATAAWTLSKGDGTKRVYAQFKDGDGNESAVVSDTIRLDTTGPKAKRVRPKRDATAVKAATKVKIVASERLRKSSVTPKTVFLKRQGGSGKVRAKVSYDAATRTIVLTPKAALAGGATYEVRVKGVKDAHGLTWDQKPKKAGSQPLRYSFTTA